MTNLFLKVKKFASCKTKSAASLFKKFTKKNNNKPFVNIKILIGSFVGITTSVIMYLVICSFDWDIRELANAQPNTLKSFIYHHPMVFYAIMSIGQPSTIYYIIMFILCFIAYLKIVNPTYWNFVNLERVLTEFFNKSRLYGYNVQEWFMLILVVVSIVSSLAISIYLVLSGNNWDVWKIANEIPKDIKALFEWKRIIWFLTLFITSLVLYLLIVTEASLIKLSDKLMVRVSDFFNKPRLHGRSLINWIALIGCVVMIAGVLLFIISKCNWSVLEAACVLYDLWAEKLSELWDDIYSFWIEIRPILYETFMFFFFPRSIDHLIEIIGWWLYSLVVVYILLFLEEWWTQD
jgi:hypothetical protein